MDRLFKGVFLTLGVLIGFSLVFAVGFHSAGEILGGTFNGNFIFEDNVTFNGDVSGISSGSVPSGFIGAFYLTTCPSGWKPADGTNSTIDLRGQFLRGLNTFDAGTTTRNDGKQDPDGDGRGVGSWQNESFLSHTHDTLDRTGGGGSTYAGCSAVMINPTQTWNLGPGTSTGGNETRPNNVAVIYCIKE